MNVKKIRTILLLIVVVLVIIFILKQRNPFNENNQQKIAEIFLNGETGEVFSLDVLDSENRPDKQLTIKYPNKEILIDTYDFIGFSDANIENIFSYGLSNTDIIIVIVSWDATNKALGVFANYYEVHMYLPSGEIYSELSTFFEPGSDGITQNGDVFYKFKTKEEIISKLQGLGY